MTAGNQVGEMVGGRKWGMEAGEARGRSRIVNSRRNSRRRELFLSPKVLAVALLMIAATLFVTGAPGVMAAPPVSSAGSTICEHCPSGETGCIPNCTKGPPPCNPVPESVSITSVVVTPESTNVSFSWDESPAGYGGYIQWGNTTSYGYSQTATGSASYTAFLDYIQPSTTYYFEIYTGAPASTCDITWSAGNYFSSFATPSDSQLFISGTITNAAGTVHAPAGVAVVLYCTGWNSQDAEFGYSSQNIPSEWWNYTLTNSKGGYYFDAAFYSEPSVSICNSFAGHHWVIQVLNQPSTCFDGVCPNGKLWPGFWNESIVTWSPQITKFYVPAASTSSSAIVSAMEFTHSDFAQVSLCKDSSSSAEYESTASQSGSFLGISYGVTSTSGYSTNFGSSSCVDDQGDPGFEAWGSPSVTGEISFNAVTGRSVSVPWTQYSGPLSNAASGNATTAPVQDWLSEPTSESGSCVNTYGDYMYHYEVPANSATQTFNFFAGGTVSGVSGETFGVSVPLELDDVSIGNFGGSWGYSLTTTISNEFYESVVIPGPVSVTHYFTVACSPSSVSETGIAVHVWQDSGPA
jgi:hypothetical protein